MPRTVRIQYGSAGRAAAPVRNSRPRRKRGPFGANAEVDTIPLETRRDTDNLAVEGELLENVAFFVGLQDVGPHDSNLGIGVIAPRS